MPVDFAADLAVAFRNGEAAAGALYRASGVGAGAAVTVIFSDPTAEIGFAGARAVTDHPRALVQRAEIPAPAGGDTLELTDADGAGTGEIYAVRGAPGREQPHRDMWQVELRKL